MSENSHPQPRLWQRLLRLVPVALSIIGLLFLLSQLDWQQVQGILQNAALFPIVLSLVLAIGIQFIGAARWWLLLSQQPRYGDCCRALFIGNFTNTFTPLRMGDIARAYIINRQADMPLSTALSTILLGHLMDVSALLVLGVIVAFTIELPPEVLQGGLILAGVGVIGAIGLAVVLRGANSQMIQNRLTGSFRRIVSNAANGFNSLQDRRLFVLASLLSLGFWFGLAITNWILLSALLDDSTLILGLTVAFAAGMGQLLPALPGGIGTLDAAVLVSLSIVGLSEDVALAFVILLRLRYVVMFGLPGIVALLMAGVSIGELRQARERIS